MTDSLHEKVKEAVDGYRLDGSGPYDFTWNTALTAAQNEVLAVIQAEVEALADEWEREAPHGIVGAAVASDLRELVVNFTPKENTHD